MADGSRRGPGERIFHVQHRLHRSLCLAAVVALVSLTTLAAGQAAGAADEAGQAGHVLVVEDDGRILAPPEPFPLAGRRLTLVPTAAGGYTSRLGESRGLLHPGERIDFSSDPTGVARTPLRTPFVFFGASYGEIFVHAQGAVSFGEPLAGAPRAAASGELLPGLIAGPPVVAALWNELGVGGNDPGTGVFVDVRDDSVLVTWYRVSSVRPAGEPNTFRITLWANGTIDIDYATVATRWGVVGVSPGAARRKVRLADFAARPTVEPETAVLAWYRDLPALNEIALAHKVFERLPDRFQFLTVFTTQPVDGPSSVWSTTVQNSDRGIGMPIFDHGEIFGAGNLEHIVVMNDIDFYADDPMARPRLGAYAYAPSTLAVLAHETGHRWLAYAGNIDPGFVGTNGHWSYLLDSGGSFLGGNDLQENPDGSFTSLAAMQAYGPLDQYLMGLRPANEVQPFFVVEDAHDFLPATTRGGDAFGPESHPEQGVTFRGTRRDVSIDAIVERSGPRVPPAGKARTSFRMAMVLVVPAGAQPDPADLAKVERIRRAFGPFFRAATGNRARMHTWLPATRDAARTVVPDPLLLSGRPQILAATARRDSSGRAEIVLDYADLDGDLTTLEVTTDASRHVAPAIVDVALGTLSNRRGSVSFALRDLPAEATALQIVLVDNRGLRTRSVLRFTDEPTELAGARWESAS